MPAIPSLLSHISSSSPDPAPDLPSHASLSHQKEGNHLTLSKSATILLRLLQQFSQSDRAILFAYEILIDNPDSTCFHRALSSAFAQPLLYLCLTDQALLLVNTDKNAISRVPFRSDLRNIKLIALSERDANLFSLTIARDTTTDQIQLICRQRNIIVQAIQIAMKTYYLDKLGQICSVEVVNRAFSQVKSETNLKSSTIRTPGTRQFYRAGYWFDAPAQFVDKNESLPNRPFSTYFMSYDGEGEADLDGARLLVRIEPQRQLLMTNEHNCHSDQSLRLWTEMCAHTLARNELIAEEADPSQYLLFENSRLTDKGCSEQDGQWIVYRIMVALPSRHIAVIGLRRNFIPPLADLYQDLLFVYIDERQPLTSPNRSSINECCGDVLVEIVRSIRPAPESDMLSPDKIPYYSSTVLQARADAFLDDVQTSNWIRSTLSIRPERTVLGTRWKHLLFAFCGTLLRLTPDFANPLTSAKSSTDEREQKWQRIRNLAFAEDPLSLMDCIEDELITQNGIGDNESAHAAIRARIAAQFMNAVDGSENARLPIRMSIETIVQLACDTKDIATRSLLNRVLNYLGHIRAPGKAFEPSESLLDKIKDDSLMKNFVCNEYCLVGILSPSHQYLEGLIRESNWSSDVASASIVSFYKALLVKNYNLDLFRAACLKISLSVITKSTWHNWLSLLDPLTTLLEQGNIYVKRWVSDALYGLISNEDLLKEVLSNGKVLEMATENLLVSNDYLLMESSARLLSLLIPPSERFQDILTRICQPIVKLLTPVVRGQKRSQGLCREVAVLISTLSTIEGDHGLVARLQFQRCDAITALMAFLEEHQFYVDIVEPIGKAIGSLFYQSEKTLKRQAILHLETLKKVLIQSTSRSHRCIILQIITNISFRSFPVIYTLRKMGFDKLLKAYHDVASSSTSEQLKEDPVDRFERIQELNILSTLYNRIAKLPVIQICLLIECTAVMGEYVKLLPAALRDAVKTMKLGIEGCACEADIKISFVGYRISPGKYVTAGFDDETVISEKLASLRVKGSNPAASNMLGAMLHSLEECDWNGDLRFLVVLAANPPYGRRFHDDSVNDVHPNKKYGKDRLNADEVLEDIRLANIDILMECVSDTLQMTFEEFRKCQLNVNVFPDLGFEKTEERIRYFSQSLAQRVSGVFVQQFN